MAGQVAYHLLAQAGAARAPWPITTIVSCLPVLVLAMGTALAHMLRADATAADTPDGQAAGPAAARSADCSPEDQRAGRPDHDEDQIAGATARIGHLPRTSKPGVGHSSAAPSNTERPVLDPAHPQKQKALLIARELAHAGRPVSRRALRSGGVKGSNDALNALARTISAELLKEGTTLS